MAISEHGFETDSEDNRTRISQLLENYKAGLPFTKELLQNADDAKAEHLICGITNELTQSSIHPLFKTPGVFILNNGEFTERDNQFFNKFKGSKINKGESIGRFGLGLKSVFHFCEAFFYISDSHQRNPQVFSKVGFRNPWCPNDDTEEFIHRDWEDKFDEDLISSSLLAFIKPWISRNNYRNWFLIWVPLRSNSYESDPECLINENFFYEEEIQNDSPIWKTIFGKNLEDDLVSTFPLLQNLKTFQIFEFHEQGGYQRKVLIQKDNTLRQHAICLENYSEKKAPIRDEEIASITTPIKGKLNLENGSYNVKGFQCGQIENQFSEPLKRIFEDKKWPKHQGRRKKAMAHAAFLMIFPDQEKVECEWLHIQRCAFLPLTTDHRLLGANSNNSGITLLLHGYYFTDHARQYALDDKWNHTLARELIANGLLTEIAEFLNSYSDRFSLENISKFTQFLINANEQFFEIKFAIQQRFLVYRVSSNNEFNPLFQSFSYDQTANLFPIGISCENKFVYLVSALPGIENLLKDKIVYLSRHPKIFNKNKEISAWSEKILEIILNEEANFKLDEKETLEVVIEFLDAIPSDQLAHHLVRKVLASSYQKTKPAKFVNNWKILGKLYRYCGKDKVLYLDFKKLHGDLGEKLLEVFCKKSSEFIVFNQEDDRSDQNCFQVAKAALNTILSWVNEDPIDEKRKNKGAEIALSIIQFCKPEERGSLLKNRKLLKCNQWENGRVHQELYSLNELTEIPLDYQILAENYLNKCFAKSIEKGACIIPCDHWPQFNPPINLYISLETYIQSNPVQLGYGEERKRLLSESIQNVREYNLNAIKLHRFFLHGVREQFENDQVSLFEPRSGCWAKIARKLFEHKDEYWKILNPEYLTQLSQEQKDILNIKSMEMNDIISELIENRSSISSLDLSDLSEQEIIEIYDQSDLLESKSAGLFKLLPIHDSIESGLISIDEQTFLKEGSYPLPWELNNGYKFLNSPKNDHILIILKRYAQPLDKLKVLTILINQKSPTQYSKQICEILKSHKLADHKSLKQSVQSVAWNKRSNSGSAISLNRIFHPDYDRAARAITQQAQNALGYCTATELEVPSGLKKEVFQKVIREFCIQDEDNLNALKSICRNNSIFFGISYHVYSEITDGPDQLTTQEKKEAFFNRILVNKSVLNAISPSYPLLKVLSNIWHETRSISHLESFLGVNSDEYLFGVSGSEETISVLNTLADVSGTGEKVKEDVFQTFLDFLKSSVEELYSFKELVLPKIKLLSASSEWKATELLCKADPTISNANIINPKTEQCLPSDLPSADPFSTPQNIDDEDLLKEYFEYWIAFLPKPVIGGFLSFLGDITPGARELSEKYLQSQTPEQVRALLSIQTNVDFRNKETPISIASEEGLEARNIINKLIPVDNFSSDSIPDLFARIRKQFDTKTRNVGVELQLIPIHAETTRRDQIDQLTETFANTWLLILRDSFKFNDRPALDALIEKLSDTSWVDIYFAQAMVFDGIFRYLRDKNFPQNSEIGKLTNEYNNRLKDKAHADEIKDLVKRNEAKEKFSQIERSLSSKLKLILEKHSDAINSDAEFLISDVRNTINRHYQYTQESIAFEIFQNADDALLQLPEENRTKKSFHLDDNKNEITFVHWGRPVNSWNGTGLTKKEASQRKYDEDLVKMLFLNSSAKNIEANNNTTGKFGVGFKSVYLICDKPKIISDGIDFEIVCGFYPRKLDVSEKDILENQLPGSDKGRTAVILEKSKISPPDPNLFTQFLNCAPFLPVFAKAIDEVSINNIDGENFSFQYRRRPESLHYFHIGDILENNIKYRSISFFKLGEFGKLLVQFDGKIFSPIPDTPTFWVTVPTDVKLGLGFLLNGQFHLDIGRASLHRDKTLNEQLTRDMQDDFKKGLNELWEYTEKKAISPDYEFWNSLWSLFAIGLLDRLRNDEEQPGLELIKLLLWGNSQDNGYGWFIREKKVIPNGIESNPRLLKKDEVKYNICSKLYEYLPIINDWDHLESTLHNSVSKEVDKILMEFSSDEFETVLFDLDQLIKFDPSWINKKADINNAVRLGSLFTEELKRDYNLVYSENNPWERIQNDLSKIRFLSKDNNWENPKELFVSEDFNEENKSNLETHICSFAPSNFLLCDQITSNANALNFFKICRDGFNCPSEDTILDWCTKFSSTNTKTAFLKFLTLSYKVPESICNQIAENKHIADWLKKEKLLHFILEISTLTEREKWIVIGKIFPEEITKFYGEESGSSGGESEDNDDHYRDETIPNSDEYLRSLLNEFRNRKDYFLNYYKEKFYPNSVDPAISPDWEESRTNLSNRKEWLKIFIASLTFRFGFALPQVTKGFIESCERKNYLDTFAELEPDPVKWLNLLESWIENEGSSGQRHFQLFGCFPSFYKFSRYLDDYVRNIFSYLDEENPDSSGITDLEQNPILDGSGRVAPVFTKDVSLGAHFIMAEFARITGEKNATSFYNHCFLPKKSIRKLLINLGCTGLSEEGHSVADSKIICDFLKEKLGPDERDYTFDYCFHIPLLLQSDSRFKPIIE